MPTARRRPAPPVGEPSAPTCARPAPTSDALLDALLGGAVAVDGGWSTAVDAALAHPDAVVVTRDGGRFGADRLAGRHGVHRRHRRRPRGGAGSAPPRPPTAANHAESSLHGARSLLDEARQSEAALARQLDEHDGRLTAATDGLQRVEADRRDAATEADALRSHAAELGERLAREQARVAELELTLPLLEAEEADSAERARAMADAKAHLEERAAAVGSLRADLEVRAAGLAERRQFLRSRLAEVEARLEGSMEAPARGRGAPRRARRQAGRRRPARRPRRRAARHGRDASWASSASGAAAERGPAGRRRPPRRASATSAPTPSAAWRRPARRPRRAELDEAEVKLRLETAVETLRRDLDVEPDVADGRRARPRWPTA